VGAHDDHVDPLRARDPEDLHVRCAIDKEALGSDTRLSRARDECVQLLLPNLPGRPRDIVICLRRNVTLTNQGTTGVRT